MSFWRRVFNEKPGGTDGGEDMPLMGFGEHLEELRRRVIYAILGGVVGIAFCLYHVNDVIGMLYQPYFLALRNAGYPGNLIYQNPLGSFISAMVLGMQAGLVLASPWIIYQAWRFVAVGLYPRERKLVYKYMGPSMFLFAVGVAFFFFLVLPVLLKFTMQFNTQLPPPSAQPYGVEKWLYPATSSPQDFAKLPSGNKAHLLQIPIVRSDPTKFAPGAAVMWYNAVDHQLKLHVNQLTLALSTVPANSIFASYPLFKEYRSFVVIMCLIFGLSFELPMVMLILSQIGIVKASQFRKMWRIAIMTLAVTAILLAPSPDVFTFLSVFIPLVLLYVLGLILATVATHRRELADARDEAEYAHEVQEQENRDKGDEA